MLAEVVVVVSTVAAVVAVALMPFFTRLLAQLLSVLASRCAVVYHPLCPALSHVKCLHRIICTSQVSV